MSETYGCYLAVGAALFVLGGVGFMTRRNLILIFLSAELMLHGVSLTLLTFGRMHRSLEGQSFTAFILTVAACEAALGLSLILSLYQRSRSLDVDLWSKLREADLPSYAIARDADQAPLEEEPPDAPSPRLASAGRRPMIDDDFPATLARTTDPRTIVTPPSPEDEESNR
jgi:NADH-quinone oxidoreductase subunit K